jgi:hypothetical protein
MSGYVPFMRGRVHDLGAATPANLATEAPCRRPLVATVAAIAERVNAGSDAERPRLSTTGAGHEVPATKPGA